MEIDRHIQVDSQLKTLCSGFPKEMQINLDLIKEMNKQAHVIFA